MASKNRYENTANRAKKSRARFGKQSKRAAEKSKYGRSGKPAPIVVRDLYSGEVVRVEKPRQPLSQREKARRERAKKEREKREQATGSAYSPALEQLAVKSGYESYEDFLCSAVWRKMRSAALVRDGFACARCQSKQGLQVHHLRYGKLDEVPLDWLQTLCGQCHHRTHRPKRKR